MSESSSPPPPESAAAGAGGGPADLGDRLVAAFRTHSLETSFFLQAVADRLGMGTTDFACLTILLLEGPTTAGGLAERTGLTTGAITGVIDRLAGQGRVRRAADPADRRRVVVEPVAERAGDMAALLQPMVDDARRLHDGFSAGQLRAVLRFVSEASQMLARNTERLRTGGGGMADGAPGRWRGELEEAELRLSSLAAHTVLRAGDTGDELYRVDASGPPPSVRSSAGRLAIKVRARGRGAPCAIVVSDAVRWAVEVTGGSSHLEADLSQAQVSGVTLRGGASRVEVSLPVPTGAVPVRVAGGASRLAIRRPAGVAVSVTVRGGASDVTVDGHRLRWAGAETRVGALPAGGAGYDIEVRGGANRLLIDQA